MNSNEESQIQVAIRIRPLIEEERGYDNTKLKIDKNSNTIITFKEKLDMQKGF